MSVRMSYCSADACRPGEAPRPTIYHLDGIALYPGRSGGSNRTWQRRSSRERILAGAECGVLPHTPEVDRSWRVAWPRRPCNLEGNTKTSFCRLGLRSLRVPCGWPFAFDLSRASRGGAVSLMLRLNALAMVWMAATDSKTVEMGKRSTAFQGEVYCRRAWSERGAAIAAGLVLRTNGKVQSP